MKRSRKFVVRNDDGNEVKLTPQEKYNAEYTQRLVNEAQKRFGNSLGYEISITTLTQISKLISEQKFYQIPFGDYLPVRVGEATWMTNLVTYRSFDAAGEFEQGLLNMGGQNSRLASADTGLDALSVKIFPWGKELTWSIFELEQAAMSGNWDVVSQKEKARKKNWDLGMQRIAFLGMRGNNGTGGDCLGLLNQAGVTENTTVITKSIKSMSTSELKTFVADLLEAYRANCNQTAYPTHFIIPESDYNGLASQASPDYPIKSTLQLLREAFMEVVPFKGFKDILPLSYADSSKHADVTQIAGKQVYTMLNYNEESLRMDIPLQYTNTLANSLNNFQMLNVGYGQFTGVLAYRPLEMMYFTY